MAETLTVELDEKGNIGKLPDALQKFLEDKINDGYKRGAQKVENDYKGKIADPAEKERLKLLEEENNRFKEEKALAEKNWEEAARLKDERYTKQLAEKDEHLTAKDKEIARRETRLRSTLGSEVKAAAAAAGARDESLPELEKLLGAELDLDPQTLEAFVKGEDGKPLMKDGKPVSIEGFVAQYLADHPHHLSGGRGKSGRATGGATMRGLPTGDDKESALAAAAENPNPRNLDNAIGAIRKAHTKS